MKARHDGADRNVEDLRGIRIAELADVDEDENVPEVVRHRSERLGDVIVLVDIGDFSYADAAQILEIPIGTVMSRLHRGRRILKRELAEQAVGSV